MAFAGCELAGATPGTTDSASVKLRPFNGTACIIPNAFHGDLFEIWNGSLFNGEDYFLHANDTSDNIARKPRSTVNEFGVSAGGPIRRNKLFFFAHYDVRHNVSAYGLYQIPFHSSYAVLPDMFAGWSFSETAILHSGLPFSFLSQPYIANGNGVFQANGASTIQFNAPAYANRVTGVPIYTKNPSQV
jgi:hypothetical protein